MRRLQINMKNATSGEKCNNLLFQANGRSPRFDFEQGLYSVSSFDRKQGVDHAHEGMFPACVLSSASSPLSAFAVTCTSCHLPPPLVWCVHPFATYTCTSCHLPPTLVWCAHHFCYIFSHCIPLSVSTHYLANRVPYLGLRQHSASLHFGVKDCKPVFWPVPQVRCHMSGALYIYTRALRLCAITTATARVQAQDDWETGYI